MRTSTFFAHIQLLVSKWSGTKGNCKLIIIINTMLSNTPFIIRREDKDHCRYEVSGVVSLCEQVESTYMFSCSISPLTVSTLFGLVARG